MILPLRYRGKLLLVFNRLCWAQNLLMYHKNSNLDAVWNYFQLSCIVWVYFFSGSVFSTQKFLNACIFVQCTPLQNILRVNNKHVLYKSTTELTTSAMLLFLQISLACLASLRPPWTKWFLWPKRWRDWGLPYLCWSEVPPRQSNTLRLTQIKLKIHFSKIFEILTISDMAYMICSGCYSLKQNIVIVGWMRSNWIYNSKIEALSVCVELK